LKARDFFQEVDHPVIGRINVPFRLFNVSEGAAEYRMPAPLLGQHNEEILRGQLGLDDAHLADLAAKRVI
jgi:crotonobetainyl-CoA:carnitine CoA-transferase CaiB-like acyl-CoA transferase